MKEALTALVTTLWDRMIEDAANHSRSPCKICLTWRQGYNQSNTTRSAAAPQLLSKLLQPLLQQQLWQQGLQQQEPEQQQRQQQQGRQRQGHQQQQQQGWDQEEQQQHHHQQQHGMQMQTSGLAAAAAAEAAAGRNSMSPTGSQQVASGPRALLSSGADQQAVRCLLEVYLGVFRGATSSSSRSGGLQVTRLAVAVCYNGDGVGGEGAGGAAGGGGSGGSRQIGQGLGPGQKTLHGFVAVKKGPTGRTQQRG